MSKRGRAHFSTDSRDLYYREGDMRHFTIVLNLFTIILLGMILLLNLPVYGKYRALVLGLLAVTPPMNLMVFFNNKKENLTRLIATHFRLTCGHGKKENDPPQKNDHDSTL